MEVHVYTPGIQEAESEGQASLGYNVWSIFKKGKILFDPLAFLIRIFILLPCSF